MKHSKRQVIDNSLFLYGGLVAIALTGIAFTNLNSLTSVVTLILFLPVSIYFVARMTISLGRLIENAFGTDLKRYPYWGNFSISTFLSQTETSFLINLTLIALTISLILFKISLTTINK